MGMNIDLALEKTGVGWLAMRTSTSCSKNSVKKIANTHRGKLII
jgi:hypothetical protein